MYKLVIHKKVTKFLLSRSTSERKIIRTKISLLKENPFNHPELDSKKLKGRKRTFRLRIGNIRIIYQVQKGELIVLVITANTRSNIYKKRK